MNTRTRAGALIAAGAVLLAGCASSQAATDPPAKSTPPSQRMTAGMVMPDGSTMGAGGTNSTTAAQDGPSAAEKMICGSETRTDIAEILGLKSPPRTTSTWVDHRYTCTYDLPMGTFVVSVKRSADPAAARVYFTHLRTTLGATRTLAGLGTGSYGTAGGKVVLIKDNDTLTVDATRLPAVFGSQGSKRFDFAYQLASDILGCWTGD